MVLDGAANICMLKPTGSMAFKEYADCIFLPYLNSPLKNIVRLDVVWDVYTGDSLKFSTREKRGKGIRRRENSTINTVPSNWQEFLRVAENKSELFQYLAIQAAKNLTPEKNVFLTYKQNVLTCNSHQDISQLFPTTHEEADSRMFLHVRDAITKCLKKVMIRTVDRDVLVLAVYCASLSTEVELWVAFGVGNKKRYVPAHKMASKMGDEQGVTQFHPLLIKARKRLFKSGQQCQKLLQFLLTT